MAQNLSNQDRAFHRALGYSVGTHLVLFALLLLFWGKGQPPPQPEMKVEWMRLGFLNGPQEGDPYLKANKLPQTTIQEQKNARIDQPPPTQVKKPGKVEPEQKIGVDKNKVVVEDKAKKQKTEKQPKTVGNTKAEGKPTKVDPRINQALAKINEDLKTQTALPEAAQIKPGGEGNPLGSPGGSNSECAAYSSRVKQKIIGNWIRLSAGQKPPRPPKIFVSINAGGAVTSTNWLQKSGDVSLDGSALRAVQNSSPFPTPPQNCQIALSGGITVQFGR